MSNFDLFEKEFYRFLFSIDTNWFLNTPHLTIWIFVFPCSFDWFFIIECNLIFICFGEVFFGCFLSFFLIQMSKSEKTKIAWKIQGMSLHMRSLLEKSTTDIAVKVCVVFFHLFSWFLSCKHRISWTRSRASKEAVNFSKRASWACD